MSGKQMEGNNEQRRTAAREAREAGKQPSEVGATLGASKQRQDAPSNASHQEKIDLKREGKMRGGGADVPVARPGSRDPDTEDTERFPRK